MNVLWLGILLLLLPALWFLFLPFKRTTTIYARQHQFETHDHAGKQNLAVYEQRLAALETAHERGDFDLARFEESRLELDRNLLEDTAARQRQPLKQPQAGRFLIPLVMVAVVVGSALGYQWVGAEGNLTLYAVEKEVLTSPNGSMAMLIERLEEQAERQADNPNVWSSLFPLYRDSGQFDLAINALERIIELVGRESALLAQLAQMKFFAADRVITEELQALMDEALEKEPGQPTVLGMLGVEAFDSGRYKQAIDYWSRALSGFGDSESSAALQKGIDIARQRLSQSSGTSGTAVGEGENAALKLRVSLAEPLQGAVSDDDIVLIIARDIEGELPPLAVTQATVADLPLEVTLDDDDAMVPTARLSQVDSVQLTVRVIDELRATPKPGDLFGESGPLSFAGGPLSVEVLIDRVVGQD